MHSQFLETQVPSGSLNASFINPGVCHYHRTASTLVSPCSVSVGTHTVITQPCKHMFTALFIPRINCYSVAMSTRLYHWHFSAICRIIPTRPGLHTTTHARVVYSLLWCHREKMTWTHTFAKTSYKSNKLDCLTIKLLIKVSNFVTIGNKRVAYDTSPSCCLSSSHSDPCVRQVI